MNLKPLINQIDKKQLITIILLFIFSYIFILIFWLRIIDYYNILILNLASYPALILKGFSMIGIEYGKEFDLIKFSYNIEGKNFIAPGIEFNIKYFFTNIPLSLALLNTFLPFLKKIHYYFIGIMILIFLHTIFAFIGLTEQLIYVENLINKEEIVQSNIISFIWEYLGYFMVYLEPFLIGVYLFILKRNQSN